MKCSRVASLELNMVKNMLLFVWQFYLVVFMAFFRSLLFNCETMKVLKQDKERSAVIMDSSKYTEKCLGILENDQFAKINDDQTKRLESKIQRCARKLKSKIKKR